jgi:hypothetical protein
MNAKKWLQGVGGGLKVFAICGAGNIQWRFHTKAFIAGALVFLSSFLTWKHDGNDDDKENGSSL